MPAFAPLSQSIEDELAEAGAGAEHQSSRDEYRKQIENDKEMSRYMIDDHDATDRDTQDWAEAEDRVRKMQDDPSKSYSNTFSVRTARASAKAADDEAKRALKRKDSGSKSSTKRKLSRAAK